MTVQRGIRTASPGCDKVAAILVGEDNDGIAAVVILGIEEDPSFVLIDCIAVALRRRGEDGAIADDAMDQAFEWAAARADESGYERVSVTGRADPRNEASKRFLSRNQFAPWQVEPDFETWRITIRLI